jgi:hypothetical protein
MWNSADLLAHDHTRQLRDNFLDFLKTNYAGTVDLAGPLARR